jgi:DNA-binding transcriptional LysR family regulator
VVTDNPAAPAAASFRLAYVPGVTPAKWVRVWTERLPEVPLSLVKVEAADGERTLREGGADAGLVRLPVDRDVLSAIPLYLETTVVVLPKDHEFADAAELALADLAAEVVIHPLDDVLAWPGPDGTPPGEPAFERPATTAGAVELVAAGIGLLVVPQSLARLHHRRDLTYRPLTDAPQSQVALSWPQDRTTDLVEEFIGVVRGRSVNSTRGRTAAAEAAKAPKKKPAGQGQQAQSQKQQRRSGQQQGRGSGPSGRRSRPRRRS